MEELSVKWESLKRLEEEQLEIEIIAISHGEQVLHEQYSLAEKIFVDCKISKEVLRANMLKLWKINNTL